MYHAWFIPSTHCSIRSIVRRRELRNGAADTAVREFRIISIISIIISFLRSIGISGYSQDVLAKFQKLIQLGHFGTL